MIYQLYREQQLKCSIETAWSFFSSPDNLSEITPKDMGFITHTDVGNTPIFVGMEINYTVSPIFKIPMKWKTKITEVDFQSSFTDFQEKGPYKLWIHHHEFIPNKEGVLMKDTVHYDLPLGFIGQIVHRLLVRKKIEEIFNYRFQILEKKFNQY